MQRKVIRIGNYGFYPDEPIGQGATGLVYRGIREQDKKPVAVKAIKISEIDTEVKQHLLQCEVNALKTIRGRYICEAYDVLKTGEYYYVPMELCPNGTLKDYIQSKVKLSEGEALEMFEKILEAYMAIKQAGFVHRDLKTENILLRANMEPAVIDFGYCEKIETQNMRLPYNVGSPGYMSPEAYNDSFYSDKSDIWSLGVIFHEMLTGSIPVMRTPDVDEYFRILKNMRTAEIIRGIRNPLCTRILLGCLTVDMRFRYSGSDILNILREGRNMSRNKSTSILYLNNQMGKSVSRLEIPLVRIRSSPETSVQIFNTSKSETKQYQQPQPWQLTPTRSYANIMADNCYDKANSAHTPNSQKPQGGNQLQVPSFTNIRRRLQANENARQVQEPRRGNNPEGNSGYSTLGYVPPQQQMGGSSFRSERVQVPLNRVYSSNSFNLGVVVRH